MKKERLLAFSDGVIAIIITIMVLELKVPHGDDWAALSGLLPVFLSYVLSFLYVAIYWNNHHHLFCACDEVNGGILWANSHLLFWLSLIPFATGWMGENHFSDLPVAVYGLSLLMPAIAYFILQRAIIRYQGPGGTLSKMIGSDWKEKASIVLYLAGMGLALYGLPWGAAALYFTVALAWLVPDPRIEKQLDP
jgi:uncharacterized membrane protein